MQVQKTAEVIVVPQEFKEFILVAIPASRVVDIPNDRKEDFEINPRYDLGAYLNPSCEDVSSDNSVWIELPIGITSFYVYKLLSKQGLIKSRPLSQEKLKLLQDLLKEAREAIPDADSFKVVHSPPESNLVLVGESSHIVNGSWEEWTIHPDGKATFKEGIVY